MILVAVTPTKMVRGVEAPGTAKKGREHTYDWRHPPGSELNTFRVKPAFEVLPLSDALGTRWPADHHLVSYVVSHEGRALERQPRVNKGGLDWIDAEGFDVRVDALFCDVDHYEGADKVPWTPEREASFLELLEREALSTVGYYWTTHGCRLIQPLDEPVSVAIVERYLDAWLEELAVDIDVEGPVWRRVVDTSCRDWTRLYRLPHVVRDGAPYVSPRVELGRMRERVVHPKACPARSGSDPPSRGDRSR